MMFHTVAGGAEMSSVCSTLGIAKQSRFFPISLAGEPSVTPDIVVAAYGAHGEPINPSDSRDVPDEP